MPIKMVCSIVGAGLTVAVLVLVGISTCIFKYGNNNNNKGYHVWSFLCIVWIVPQIAATILTVYSYKMYYIYLFIKQPIIGYILIAAAAYQFLLNILSMYISILSVMLNDSKFMRWKKHANIGKLFFVFIIEMLSIVSYKFQHLLYANLSFTPKL